MARKKEIIDATNVIPATLEDIMMNRPVKGNLICKRIKSNPSVLRDVKAIASYDTLEFRDPESQQLHEEIQGLKTFSSGLQAKKKPPQAFSRTGSRRQLF